MDIHDTTDEQMDANICVVLLCSQTVLSSDVCLDILWTEQIETVRLVFQSFLLKFATAQPKWDWKAMLQQKTGCLCLFEVVVRLLLM